MDWTPTNYQIQMVLPRWEQFGYQCYETIEEARAVGLRKLRDFTCEGIQICQNNKVVEEFSRAGVIEALKRELKEAISLEAWSNDPTAARSFYASLCSELKQFGVSI